MTDITDKYEKFKVPFGTNEHHEEDEWDPKTEGKLSDWHNRHQDKLLDEFCVNSTNHQLAAVNSGVYSKQSFCHNTTP